jgi:prolyl oligopeptidase PreP (S9A serine peptidase family)
LNWIWIPASVACKQTEVPGFDAANYRSEHLWITARDGVEVPVSLVTIKVFPKGKIRYWFTAMARMAPAWMPISAAAV